MPAPSPEPSGDFDLAAALRAVRGGDHQMLAQIAERYYPRVRRTVQRRLREDFRRNHSWIQSAFSTGDVVQNVFLRVLASLNDVRCSEEAAFLAYLVKAVENHLLDALRHHQASRRDARRDAKSDSAVLEAMSKPAPDPTPSLDASMRESRLALNSVLRSLGDKERLLWELRGREQHEFAEIAERLGYANADVARQAFKDVKAKVLVGLRRRGFSRTRFAS